MAFIFLEEFWRRQVYYDLPLYRSPKLKLQISTPAARPWHCQLSIL